jgi:hypothetical protein
MITLGTESCGTNLLGGTVFFHCLAHAFTLVLAKLSHLFGDGRSVSVAAPLGVGGSVAVGVAVTFTRALLFVVVFDIHVDIVLVSVIVVMIGRRSRHVGRCRGCHFRIHVNGITHGVATAI